MSKPLQSAWAKGAPKFTSCKPVNSVGSVGPVIPPINNTNNIVLPPAPPTQVQQNQTQKTTAGTNQVPHFNFSSDTFKAIGEYFHSNGFVIIDNAISPEQIAKLKKDLTAAEQASLSKINKKYASSHLMHKCFFEHSTTTVDIIESSKLADFAQWIIADVPDTRVNNSSLKAHVIHNNAFSVPPGGRGQAPVWHVDDPLQQVIIPYGKELPDWIKLPVLACTYMIWLSDCDSPENGPTYVVPGSHRYGQVVDPEYAEANGIPTCGKAGTAVLINSNLWHRGCANKSTRARDTVQITWARRIIGHKHKTIMNYNMPAHVYAGRSDLLKERMGWLQGGAYS